MLTAPVVTVEALRPLLGRVRLLDARSGDAGRDAYAKGHLRGALYADLERDLVGSSEEPARGGRHPLPPIGEWTATLGRWGIGPDTPVVAYDDRGGANAAARVWWMLRAVGHQPVAVLDGGWQAATEAGLPVDDRVPDVAPRGAYPAVGWQQPMADAQAVEVRRTDPQYLVIDARAPERFRGDEEPLDPVAGHIPGAVNVPFAQNLRSDGRFVPAPELAAVYHQALGTRSPDRVIVHCGSGVTACHTLLALDQAGLEGAALYVGSFSEWCRQDRPIEQGD